MLLLITAHRLPAPISEVETSTPAPKQSAKPKRAIKPKVTSESSEGQAKTSSPTPQSKATPNQSPFEGKWTGFDAHGTEQTLFINAAGTVVTQISKYSSKTWPATCEGITVRWTYAATKCAWTFTPNPDKKTARVQDDCPDYWFGAGKSTAIYRKTSP
jgi:hypothetical protein